jgi:CRISPR-associated Csx2 family protein
MDAMTPVLISFLGRSNRPDGNAGYRVATYDFGAGVTCQSSFFGLALRNHIKSERLVVIGTPGSMWDVFVEHHVLDGNEIERLALMEAVRYGQVQREMLDGLAPKVADSLGIDCRMELIPLGKDMAEQTEILKTMVKGLEPGDTVTLDLTHGLRHLPMLGLLSALYLRVARDAKINGLYYGALDLTQDGKTPVLRLDGLLHIADWIGALHGFDKDGDYAPLASLLKQDGLPDDVATFLNSAAFFERTQNVPQARAPLTDFVKKLNETPFIGVSSLFEQALRERIAWHAEERLYKRQRALARFHFDNRDYLRSVSLAFEAFVTCLVQRNPGNADPQNYQIRKSVCESFEATNSQDPQYEAYCSLRNIRNALVHGTRPTNAQAQSALRDENTLRDILENLYTQLLPE